MKNSDESAFCFQPTDPLGNALSPSWGLTKREYFAGLAMQGMLSNPEQVGGLVHYDWISKTAIAYADAILTELETPQP